jgi:hypothetical protein
VQRARGRRGGRTGPPLGRDCYPRILIVAGGARRPWAHGGRSGLHDPEQATSRKDIVAPAAHPLAVMPTMEAIVEAIVEAIMKVKAAVVAEVVEMMKPFEPQPAAIKCLGPSPVSVARPIGEAPANCVGARRERGHQDH